MMLISKLVVVVAAVEVLGWFPAVVAYGNSPINNGIHRRSLLTTSIGIAVAVVATTAAPTALALVAEGTSSSEASPSGSDEVYFGVGCYW